MVEELQARLDRVEMSAKEARSEASRQDEATRRLRALLSQVGVDDRDVVVWICRLRALLSQVGADDVMWWWRDYHCGIISGRA